MRRRVVTFDGTSTSGGFGYVGAGLLVELDRLAREAGHTDGVLHRTDAYAGTSAGGWTALFLASKADPRAALSGVLPFWDELMKVMSTTVKLSAIAGVAGVGPILDSGPLRKFMIEKFGAKTTLGDLPHPVMIPSFQLDTPDQTPRRWCARVFSTLHEDDPDRDELVVDVALRTSSPPVLDAIYQSLDGTGPGYIDGGIFANDPAMVAVTTMYHAEEREKLALDREKFLLFSLGNGIIPKYLAPTFKDGVASWGYFQWLFDPRQPLLALDVMVEANMLLSEFQLRRFLGNQYHRIDPSLEAANLMTAKIEKAIGEIVAEPSTGQLLANALEWLSVSGWMEDAKFDPAMKERSIRKAAERAALAQAAGTKAAAKPGAAAKQNADGVVS